MLRSVKRLTGATLGATDGELGTVRDLYFDELSWATRYVVAVVGSRAMGKMLLVAPSAVRRCEGSVVQVNFSRDELMSSPDVETELPLSLEDESRLAAYYGWAKPQLCWRRAAEGDGSTVGWDPLLRSAEQITGFDAAARDTEVGRVHDFLVDMRSWKVTHAVIEVGHGFTGKSVVVRTSAVSRLALTGSAMFLDMDSAEVVAKPDFDPDLHLKRGYEALLQECL